MPEYTVLTVIAVLGTVAIELCWLRTGIFRSLQYWLTMAIVFGFQIPVDGWLTKLNDPIVIYARSQMLGLRMPWDIPVEDFGFGFAMVTLTILAWRCLLDRRGDRITVGFGVTIERTAMKRPFVLAATDVPDAFDEAAARYDLMVALNPGYHRHLRSAADALARRLPARAGRRRLVDLGCGSGASTRASCAVCRPRGQAFSVIGVDASAGMLDQARAKSWPPGVRFEVGMAEELGVGPRPGVWASRCDGVLAAYLFRNVTERDKVLARGLRPARAASGTLVVQEYSVAGSRIAARDLDPGLLDWW